MHVVWKGIIVTAYPILDLPFLVTIGTVTPRSGLCLRNVPVEAASITIAVYTGEPGLGGRSGRLG